jgi:hypothetical protein
MGINLIDDVIGTPPSSSIQTGLLSI